MGWSSSRMEMVAPLVRGSQLPSGSNRGGEYASNSPRSSVRASAIAQPLFKPFSSNNFWIVLSLANTYFCMISAQAWYFSVPENSSCDCSSTGNFICMGSAHVLDSPVNASGSFIPAGRIALINETPVQVLNQSGIAYFRKPVPFWDRQAQTTISFSTTFAVDIIRGFDPLKYRSYNGDGMTFVMSANNSILGSPGAYFGIFNDTLPQNATGFKSIVVEFDHVWNTQSAFSDNNSNHVSLDFTTTTAAVTANAGTVDLSSTFYAWVDYSNKTQQLEVRVSANNNSKPSDPLLSYSMDLFQYAEEYMWVGFTAGSGGQYSNYYIRYWFFGPYVGPPRNPWTLTDIMGLSMGILAFLLACMIAIYIFVKRSDGGRDNALDGDWQLWWLRFLRENRLIEIEGMPKRFSYQKLRVATKNFSKESKLGQGGFGSVYRGVLPSSGSRSGTQMAVKKINADSNQGEKEFMAEVSIISQLRHRNLIRLLGWCEDASKEKYLLVYELMPNGSLDKALFGPTETAVLSWSQRFNIVSGIAAALEYLHQGWNQQVIHRDVKSSNIMLDEEWNAKLGDFGLARLVDHQREGGTTDVAGTRGYLAPEVVAFNKFTDKTDVYAFGAVVLEVVCGRKALCFAVPKDEIVLVDWVWQRLSEGDLMSTVDKQLKDYDVYWMEVMMTIGLLCSHPDPVFRPSMRHVVQVLAGEAPIPPLPHSKPTLVFNAIPQRIFSDHSSNSQVRSTTRSNLATMSLVSTNTSCSVEGSTTKYFSNTSLN